TQPVVPQGNQPPYDDQLLRLSDILGALHYLRQLCGSGEGTLWRDEMQALIDSEEAEAPRRARFIDRFNRGYEGFEAVYRTCTPAAALAVDRYMNEGRRIAREIVARYGRQE
ncbi:MAG: TIGR02301 family protein, partial [bacterium]|nr:TIGR02301 family protein [bacterium]